MRYGKTQKRMRHEGAGCRGAFGHYCPALESRRSIRLPPSAFLLPRAVTLVEMLAVLFVISLLAVAALRALPGDDQRPRETARMIGMFLSSAKANAQATGRPAGVVLRRSLLPAYSSGDNYYCTVLDQCSVPPLYAGNDMNVSMLAQDWTLVPNTSVPGTNVNYCSDGRTVIKLLIHVNEFPENLIRYGDQIQLNGQGPIYTICWDGADGLYSAPPANYVANGKGTMIVSKTSTGMPPPNPPWPLLSTTDSGKSWPKDYNFPNSRDSKNDPDPNGCISCLVGNPVNSAHRTNTPDDIWIDNYCVTCYLEPQNKPTLPWPAAYNTTSFYSQIPPFSFTIIRQPMKSAYGSLQLPARSGIDLLASGYDRSYFNSDVAILFSPNGSVDSVYAGGGKSKPVETIYLTVGTLLSEKPNYADLRNIIISINPQSGVISTNEVAPPYYNAQNRGIQNNDLPPFVPNPTWTNQFDPNSPLKLDLTKPWNDPVNLKYCQALYYSRAFAREAQMMGGKR